MKRKKWSEVEEQTLISKYSDLKNSGTLSKLKTREKKFKPIAEHVNSLHHHIDPITFPFKWSWRDVSIKVQNMRYQYLGVKQKIRISCNEFNWDDGEIHWENFLKYKEVFGDIELSDHIPNSSSSKDNNNSKFFGDEGISDILGYQIDDEEDVDEDEEEEEEDVDEEEDDLEVSDGGGANEEIQELGFDVEKKLSKGFNKGKKLLKVGARVLELRDVIVRREEKRREREGSREDKLIEYEMLRNERELLKEKRLNEREEGIYANELKFEEMQMTWAKREFEKRRRLEREFEDEKKRRMKLEEKWEEEEMQWRERMIQMQMMHDKQMMQMHAEASQNQLQILGVVARLVYQYFGSGNDGLGGSLGSLTPQVLQNLEHQGGCGDSGKQDTPSEFC